MRGARRRSPGSFGCRGQSSALATEVMQHLGPAHARSVVLLSAARGFRCRARRGGRFPATWQSSPETGARLRRILQFRESCGARPTARRWSGREGATALDDGLVAIPFGIDGKFHGTLLAGAGCRSSKDRLLEETDLSAGAAGRSFWGIVGRTTPGVRSASPAGTRKGYGSFCS
jgi:hypothetical protein